MSRWLLTSVELGMQMKGNRNISANTLQKYNISDARCGRAILHCGEDLAVKIGRFVYSVFSWLWGQLPAPSWGSVKTQHSTWNLKWGFKKVTSS